MVAPEAAAPSPIPDGDAAAIRFRAAVAVRGAAVPAAAVATDEAKVELLEAPAQQHDFSLTCGDLAIKRGGVTAVVGGVGSGKSTLLDACLGRAALSKGGVASSQKAGYAPQQPFVASGTVLENILLGRPLDEDAFSKAVAVASLGRDLGLLPEGRDTTVGERGTTLSGGQQHRLGVARAVYGDPELLLLDASLAAVPPPERHGRPGFADGLRDDDAATPRTIHGAAATTRPHGICASPAAAPRRVPTEYARPRPRRRRNVVSPSPLVPAQVDAAVARGIFDALKAWAAEDPKRCVAIVLSQLHFLPECDRVVLLDKGRVLVDGTHLDVQRGAWPDGSFAAFAAAALTGNAEPEKTVDDVAAPEAVAVAEKEPDAGEAAPLIKQEKIRRGLIASDVLVMFARAVGWSDGRAVRALPTSFKRTTRAVRRCSRGVALVSTEYPRPWPRRLAATCVTTDYPRLWPRRRRDPSAEDQRGEVRSVDVDVLKNHRTRSSSRRVRSGAGTASGPSSRATCWPGASSRARTSSWRGGRRRPRAAAPGGSWRSTARVRSFT